MRPVDITLSGKVKLMEELTEKMAEKMTDEEDTIDEVETWSNATRNATDDAVRKEEEGWNFIQSYHKQKADEAQIQLLEKEKREEEIARKEKQQLELQAHQEKLAWERAAWQEHQQMVLETKQKELDLVRKEKTQSAKLPKLTITPFRGTTRD